MARFTHHCALRWSDMDAFRHLNNARFLTLYEEARVALLFDHAARAGVSTLERGVVIARHEIDYLRAVDYESGAHATPRAVRIELWVDEIRHGSFAMGYEMYDDGRLASRARSVLVPYDLAEGRPRRLNEKERAFLAEWRHEPVGADGG